MPANWLNLLKHELLGVALLFLILEIWQNWHEVRSFGRRWPQEVAHRQRRQAIVASRSLPGLARRPVCAEC